MPPRPETGRPAALLDDGRALPRAAASERLRAALVRSGQPGRPLPGRARNQPVQRVPSARIRARAARRWLRPGRVSPRRGRRAARHPPSAEAGLGPGGMRDRLERVLDSLERLASRPLGAFVLFFLALAVYGLRAVGWPLIGGRDLDEYLYGYIQFLDWHPLLPWSMLFRTPVTGVVAGASLDFAGGFFAEPLLAVLFAASVVAWSAAARAFGARAALLVAVALLLY